MTDETTHPDEQHQDQQHQDQQHQDQEHLDRETDDFDAPWGRRRGPGRRFGGRHHVHHVHVHHHGGGPGRRGRRRGRPSVEDRIAFLEELQRDLEQDVADVAAKIVRLREAAG